MPLRRRAAIIITVHQEAGPHLHRTIQRIKALWARRRAFHLNPSTPAKMLDYMCWKRSTSILVMSVNPGFRRAELHREPAQARLRRSARSIDKLGKLDIHLAGRWRGGYANTAPRVIAAGADVLVAGTATFKGGPSAYADNIKGLRGG
jgi:ribulose-phosphate 3-epimerase